MFRAILLLFMILVIPMTASAIMEFSTSVNYRRSTIDENNYQESVSYTGSISYYFGRMSALELSYTKGSSFVSIQPQNEESIETTSEFELYGADLVITFSGRKATVQPYIKAGGAYIDKKIVRVPEGQPGTEIPYDAGLVPSGGLGVKVRFSRRFGIKVGADIWTSPLDREDMQVDWAGRAGISWML